VTFGKQLTQLMPTQSYIILVDRARDHRHIKRGDQVMLHALVSTGKQTITSLSSTDGSPWHGPSGKEQVVFQAHILGHHLLDKR
jgi:hypothetical protein